MRKPLVAVLTTAAITVGTALTGTAVTTSAAAAETTLTDLGFQGTAYGTRVTAAGGTLVSGSTAFAWLGCTRHTGVAVDRAVGEVNLPTDDPYISISAIESQLRTFRQPSEDVDAGVTSTNIIGNVVLGNASTPQLSIDRLQSTSTAWSTLDGTLRTANEVSSGAIGLTGLVDPGDDSPLGQLFDAVDAGLDEVLATLEANGGSIEVPDLGMVHIGAVDSQSVTPRAAAARSSVLRVDLYGPDGDKTTTADNSTIDIGHSRARINRDVDTAVMGGRAYGADGDVADETLSIGQLGDLPLPCRGTEGAVQANPLASFGAPGDQFELSGIQGRVFGENFSSGAAKAWTEGSVSSLKVGTLEINGIVGRVNLVQDRRGRIIRNNIGGSRIGEIVVDGESQGSFGPADAGQLPVDQLPPEVASVELFTRDKRTRSNQVTAVTITFAEGTPGASVLRLGYARARLGR